MEILKNIPFELDFDKLLSKLSLEKDSEYTKEVESLVDSVTPVITPKAIYEVAYIQEKGEDTVNIDGVEFTSHVLRVNLDEVERVFPYIATCGKELDEVEISSDDFLARYWLDAIKEMALRKSMVYLYGYLKDQYALGKTSSMSPGSAAAEVWPIGQQKHLFSIFGDVEKMIGVKLTESCLMIPNKSVSGVILPTEVSFRSCQLCPREGCPGRSAPYDEDLLKKRYGKNEK